MNQLLIDNLHALMDQNKIAKSAKARAKYLAQYCDDPADEIELFLLGEGEVPSKGFLKKNGGFF